MLFNLCQKIVKSNTFSLAIGVAIGWCFSFLLLNPIELSNHSDHHQSIKSSGNKIKRDDNQLADELFDKVRVLCWVMTSPENHQIKALHVKQTWGKRCNKLLFISSQADPELGAIALPVDEGRENLWDKTKSAFRYVYQNHFDETDWFLKADDDNYIIMENLRAMLYQYRPETSFYIGHRYAIDNLVEGYMAGGGYVLSKKLLEKLVTKIMKNGSMCRWDNEGAEDLELGKCLQSHAVFVDDRDELQQKRFFAVGVTEHLKSKYDLSYWYYRNMYYNVSLNNLDCCSDKPIALHYTNPGDMYFLDYLIYNVNVFGKDNHHYDDDDKMPRKLTLKEIIMASDVRPLLFENRSYQHGVHHNLEESEFY